jgi:hypothetical protein
MSLKNFAHIALVTATGFGAAMLSGCSNQSSMSPLGPAVEHGESLAAIGVATSLPGRIQVEDYNLGGEGIGYHDLTAGNQGGQYRTDGVDIEASSDVGGGYNIGWTDAGEWLNYSVNVNNAALYNVTARMASAVAGTKTLKILVDQQEVGGFNLTDASGWQSWKDVQIQGIYLASGSHTIGIYCATANFNLNYIDFALQGNQRPLANAGTAQTAYLSAFVTLDGSLSTDPDNYPQPLSYSWSQVSGPATVTLTNATSATASFQALTLGSYTFRLTVSDGALSSSSEVAVTVTAANLISNGDFANGLTGWSPVWLSPASGSTINDGQAAKMVIGAAGVNTWDIQLFQQSALFRGKYYKLEFYVKSEMNSKTFKAVIEHNGDPWTKYVDQQFQFTQAANTWQKFSVQFYAPVNDFNVKIGFHFGAANNYDVWLDNVTMTEVQL